MKTFLTVYGMLLICSGAFSQPVYENYFFPTAGIYGNHAEPIDAQNSDEGPAGADVVWDFQHWEPDVETSVGWFQTLPEYMDYPTIPNANLGWVFYDSVMREEYYIRDENTLSLIQMTGGLEPYNPNPTYTNPHVLRVAPLNFLDSFTDTYRAYSWGPYWDFLMSGVRTTVYDGYGTLGIRGEWRPNTIRLRTDNEWRDTVYEADGFNLIHHNKRTSYEWFNIDKCGPDASIHYTTVHTQHWYQGTLVDSFTTPQQIFRAMLDGCIHVSTEEAKGLSGIQFNLSGSNPVQEVLRLFINSETTGRKLKLEVFDVYGKLLDSRMLTTRLGEDRVEIPVGQFASGMYVIVLSDGKGRLSKRWVKM